MPTTLNTLTGIPAVVGDNIAKHPVLSKYLKVVPDGTKPLRLVRPGTVEEFDAARKNSSKKADAPEGEDK